MAVVITSNGVLAMGSIALSAGPASAGVLFQVTMPSGAVLEQEATTDGTGAATIPFVPQMSGPVTVDVFPQSPAAIATASATV
jgi:hypothetical protein